MKLTKDQKKSLVANTQLHLVIQDRLAERERKMYATQPPSSIPEDSTKEEIEAHNISVDAWELESKIKTFNRKYYPLIENAKSIEKRLFVNALGDFNFEGIDGLMSDELVEVINSTEFKDTTVIDYLINEMFNKLMFPPQKIEVKETVSEVSE